MTDVLYERHTLTDENGVQRPFKTPILITEVLTIRDQFAMAALTGMIPSISSSNWKKIAEHSYEVADAMLEARKEKK